jgi:hypothetical protein
MFSNSIKQEVCIILENTDHVLGILGYGMCVMVSMLVSWSFFRRAASLKDRQVTAAIKHSLQSLLMIVVAFLSSTGVCRMKLIW